ncbi:frizzled-5-like [Penaeus chinensis]|uniref:frizzled-5-like n=1 Tax=Penaeus chinensis TaxID=139456 RepID=UPI001FB637D6|nr:frizzled-5-like [Penaeus chinensis]
MCTRVRDIDRRPPRSAMMRNSVFLSSFVLLVVTLVGATDGETAKESRCEEITIPMCRDIGYNNTSMPNQFNHDSQDEAGLEVHQFWPLVEIMCSTDLKFFLCSVYAPICIDDYEKPLPACRSVCERAKAGCAPIMHQYGFAWPERMDCSKLPEYGDTVHLCMDKRNGSAPEEKPAKNYGNLDKKCRGKNSKYCPKCQCSCPFVNLDPSYRQYGRYPNESFKVGRVPDCALPCHAVYFDQDERTFAQYWIAIWAILCCVSTLTTITTFLIDMDRFKYPERPIIFLSGCYFMVSMGYIIRMVAGHAEVACDGKMIVYNYHLVRHNPYGSGLCTTVFLLVYFFGMASSIWWVVLSFTWFLAAGLKWGNEAIASYSTWFHLAAWLIPTIQSIAVLVMAAVDGDSVAGICYVGNQDINNLRGFVLAPLFIYLVVGSAFLLAGFVSLFRIRNVIKQQGRTKTEKLEKLMIRIGVFSVLYTVPATIVIGCYFYEQLYVDEWQDGLVCPCSPHKGRKPDFSVLMLRYFMTLVVGITAGFWIWSGKTLDSWSRFYHRLCPGPHGHTYEYPTRPIKQAAAPSCASFPPPMSAQGTAHSVASHLGSVNKTLPLSHV